MEVKAFIFNSKIHFGNDSNQIKNEELKKEIQKWKKDLNQFPEKVRKYSSFILIDKGCLNTDII